MFILELRNYSSAGSWYLCWIRTIWTRYRMDIYLLRFYVYRVWINSDADSVCYRNSSWRKQFLCYNYRYRKSVELDQSLWSWLRSKIVYETAFEEGPTERIAHGLLRGGSHLSKFFFAQLALTVIGSISEYSRRNGSACGELLALNYHLLLLDGGQSRWLNRAYWKPLTVVPVVFSTTKLIDN